MGYPECWHLRVRPQGYEEILGDQSPVSFELQGWTQLTPTVPFVPKWTLNVNDQIDGINLTRAGTENERLVSRAFKILKRDFVFTGIFSLPFGSTNEGIVYLSLVHTPRTTLSAGGNFIFPQSISIRIRRNSVGPVSDARIDVSDGFTVTSSTALTLDTGTVSNYFRLERTGNILKLSITRLDTGVVSSTTLDISSLTQLNGIRYMQFSNYPDGTASTNVTIVLKNIKLIPAYYVDVHHKNTGRAVDFEMSMGKKESKTMKLRIDDPIGDLDFVEAGDEVLAWFDNDSDALIASYDMEHVDANGYLIDFSSNGLNLQPVGGVVAGSVENGKVEKATSFDGTTNLYDSLNTPGWVFDTIPKSGKITLACWVYLTNNTGNRWVISKALSSLNVANTLYMLAANDSVQSRARFTIGDGSNTDTLYSSIQLATSTWYHLMAVFDGGQMKLFINGVLDNSKPTSLTTILQTNMSTLKIGSSSDNTPANFFAGNIDEVSIYDRALNDVEVRDYYLRAGRCPKLYFNGQIQNMKKENDVVSLEALDDFNELISSELYDLIVEGQTLISTKGGTADKIAYRLGYGDISGTGGGFTKTFILDSDGNTIDSANSTIEDVFLARNLGWTGGNSYTDSGALDVLDTSPVTEFAYAFIARSTKLSHMWIKARWDLSNFATQHLILKIKTNVEDATTHNDKPSTTVVMTKTFTFGADQTTAAWTKFDVSDATWNADMVKGSKYWLYFSVDFDAVPSPTAPYLEIAGTNHDFISDHEIYKLNGAVESWDKNITRGITMVYTDMEETMEDMSPANFFVKYATSWMAELEGPNVDEPIIKGSTVGVSMKDVIVQGVYYSKKNMTIKNIMERIFRKTRKLRGSYSGSATTKNLGFYSAQGGTMLSHLNTLSDISNSILVNRTSNYIFVEDANLRSTLFNGTMEDTIGWHHRTSTGTANLGIDRGYSGTPKTGNRAYKIEIASTTSAVTTEIYQDIENWSGYISAWVKTDVNADADFVIKLEKEDFGGGGARTTIPGASITSTTTYTKIASTSAIAQKKFRLIISLVKAASGASKGTSLHIDDVSQQYAYYGFKDGFATEVGEPPSQEKFADIIEISRNAELGTFSNTGIRGGKIKSFSGNSEFFSAARNVPLNDKFGTKIAFRGGGNFKKLVDVYESAKALIKTDYADSITLRVPFQAAFLFGRPILLLAPNSDIPEWTYYVVYDITVGNDVTTIRSTELKTLDLESIGNIQDKQDQQGAVGDQPLPKDMLYYVVQDCQLSTGATDASIKDCQITDGTDTFTSNKFTNPDTGVYIFEFKKRDVGTTFGADRYQKDITLRNASAQVIGGARLSLGDRFVKTRNMRLFIILFNRRTGLGIS